MAKIIKVRLTEYYPFAANLNKKQSRMEGGTLDRKQKMLYTFEDYIEGNAPYVSLACDTLAGPPGKVAEFRQYGYKVWIPSLNNNVEKYIDTSRLAEKLELPITIDFRLVDTGGNFHGDNKVVEVAGYEPIDICRRTKPAKEFSFSGLLTEMWLL